MVGGHSALAVALAVSRQQSARQVHGRPPVLSALMREDERVKQTSHGGDPSPVMMTWCLLLVLHRICNM